MYNYTNDSIQCPKCCGEIHMNSSVFVRKQTIPVTPNEIITEDEHLLRSCSRCGYSIQMHTKDHFSSKIDHSNFTVDMRPVEEIEAELEVEELLR